MHSNVYTHKTVKAIEYMVTDILVLADPYLPISNGHGGATRISQAMVDSDAYLQLKDSVLDLIECSPDVRLRPAQKLIKRLRSREVRVGWARVGLVRSETTTKGYALYNLLTARYTRCSHHHPSPYRGLLRSAQLYKCVKAFPVSDSEVAQIFWKDR